MVRDHQTGDANKEAVTGDGDPSNDQPTPGKETISSGTARPTADGSEADGSEKADSAGGIGRRSLLKAAGVTAAAGIAGATGAVGRASASIDRSSSGDGYEVWTISGKEVYDLSDGEELSNILVDQTAAGACLTIRARDKSGWAVKNVGFLGVGQEGDGGNRFQFQVSVPSGGNAVIENIWANGKARNGQPASQLGGIYLRSSHAGHLDVRHTYIEGFGNNAVYASAVGKDSGNDGSITIENSYHRDNTSSQFRIGSPNSVVRNSVGIIDDPDALRGPYPGTSSNRNARGIWGKHFRHQRIENSSFYVSPNDCQPDGVFEARYIQDRSHGDEAVAEIVDCNVNADAPTLTGSTSNAKVDLSNLGENPTVTVIQNGGVPLTPEMAAKGGRSMPPELPGASSDDSTGDTGGDTNDDSTSTLDRTLAVDGSDTGRTDYTFTVSGDLEENADIGSLGTGDSIDGSTATGFVNGGVDGYRFSGDLTDITVEGNAAIIVDGQEIDPSQYGESTLSHTLTIDGNDADWTDYSLTVSGEIENDPENGSFNPQDNITGSTASGFVNGGVDGYRFSGELVDGTVDGNAAVLVDGQEIDTSQFSEEQLSRTVTIDGSNADRTDYEIAVSGEIENNTEVGSFNPDDSIDGSVASGFVSGGVDGYRFSGDIVDIQVDGNAAIIVDGQEVDPGSLVLPNHIVFDANGSSRETVYEVEVSGDLQTAPTLGSLESADSVNGTTMSGTVTGEDQDGFRFSGNLVSLRLDGEASVSFEDNDG